MTNLLTFHYDEYLPTIDNHHPKRVFLSINAIVFIYDLIEIKFSEIEDLLLQHNDMENEANEPLAHRKAQFRTNSKRCNRIVCLAWDLIDWMDRLRKILGYAAGIKKKEDWYKNLILTLEKTEKIRNCMQHFDGEINKFIKGSFPIMGSIFALFPAEKSGVYMRILASHPERTPYDKEMNIYGFNFPDTISGNIDYITFSLGKKSIDLSNVRRNLEIHKVELKEFLKKEYDFTWPTIAN